MTDSDKENRELKTLGRVFDIKRGATGDGPGLRTLVFLKGCPLRCRWCANPESQSVKPQVMYYPKLCVDCGKCVAACPTHAIRSDERFGLVTDEAACTACGLCEEACLYGARKLMGREMSVSDVMETVRRDKAHYINSGGGVTVSGGEPLMQPDFILALLKACKQDGIHTAMETCGYASWESLAAVLPYLDLIFYDLKIVDAKDHKEATGRDNARILENLKKLNMAYGGEIIVRIPYIPGYNDDIKTQEGIYRYVGCLKRVNRIEIMPYHRLGESKYTGLGREYALSGVPQVKKQDITHLIQLGEQCGVPVQIDSR